MSDQWKLNNKMWHISQKNLEEWLESVSKLRMLIAPQDVDGILLYHPIKDCSEIKWKYTRPRMSGKEFFFPLTERLLSIEKDGNEINLQETFPEVQQILFGIRPCDARGLKILDALFLDTNPIDPYYARRRMSTVLIGLACNEMGSTCFCNSMGSAPDDARDVDVMLYNIDDGYLVQAITEKGRFLIPGGEWKEANNVSHPTSVTSPPFPTPQKDKWPSLFNNEYWMRMSERCLSCRACAYVCPTCRCFAVRDEVVKEGQFERIRCWDSCTGENYRLIAGGHKPRAEKGERLRNRFFCKFYYYSEQYGIGETVACTGCGRCVDVCPVNVDITEVLADLERLHDRE